jgi:hypothetical protein
MAEAFTYDGYRELIRDYTGAGYRFGAFRDALPASALEGQPLVLMRHDIDFDLGKARAMAEVEREEGILATYFFLLRTDHYNLFSKPGSAEVERILQMGHRLGLHFDCAAYSPDATESELAAACRKEADALGSWFGAEVEIVSYHRPNAQVLTGNPRLSAPRPHAYMARFMKDMKYCSDSRGEWRYGDPRSQPEFHARKAMQILIHPLWWGAGRRGAEETLARWLDGQTEALEDSMEANCAVYRKRAIPSRAQRAPRQGAEAK